MSIISAGNTTTTALVQTADTTGNLVFTTGGANTTALTLTNAQNATFAGAVTISGATTQTGNASFSNATVSGKLGIGTTTPASTLDIVSSTGRAILASGTSSSTTNYYDGGVLTLKNLSNTANNFTALQFEGVNGNDNAAIWSINTVQTSGAVTGSLVFGTANAAAAATERARIDNVGNLLVGQTSASLAGKSAFTTSAATVGNITMRNSANTGGTYFNVGATADSTPYFVIYDQNGTGVYLAPGGTSWNAGSDETTKDIIEPISDAVNKVSSLRSVIGKYKTDEEGTRRSFLIAQDVQKVLPEAVTTSPEGTLGLQYQDIIPLLVAAVKELKAELDQTKAEVAALKAGA